MVLRSSEVVIGGLCSADGWRWVWILTFSIIFSEILKMFTRWGATQRLTRQEPRTKKRINLDGSGCLSQVLRKDLLIKEKFSDR